MSVPDCLLVAPLSAEPLFGIPAGASRRAGYWNRPQGEKEDA